MRWLLLAAMLSAGCGHGRGEIAGTLVTAAVLAIELSTEEPPPPVTYCDTDSDDPPHVCPGLAPAPPDR